jgi:hypothetical protein
MACKILPEQCGHQLNVNAASSFIDTKDRLFPYPSAPFELCMTAPDPSDPEIAFIQFNSAGELAECCQLMDVYEFVEQTIVSFYVCRCAHELSRFRSFHVYYKVLQDFSDLVTVEFAIWYL